MFLDNYQAYVHDNTINRHCDVELMFRGMPKMRLCDCHAYMGVGGNFGNVDELAAQVREDLRNMCNAGVKYTVKRDKLDGSIDIFRESDNVLMFSMECEKLEGADWVPEYNSTEG